MRLSLAVIAALVTASIVVAAAAVGQRPDPMATADPLELARHARALGDEALLARLAEGRGREQTAAARASPWMREPLAAVPALAILAGGDDPRLAPVAALALWRIARAAAEGAAQPFELDTDAAARCVEAVAAAVEASPRPDLRALLVDAEGALRQAFALPPREGESTN